MGNQYSDNLINVEVGFRKGRLTVTGPIRRVERITNSGKKRWERQVDLVCDCGKAKTMEIHNFLKPVVQSCGCQAKEKAVRRGKENRVVHPGDRFGKLTVLADSELRVSKSGRKNWFDKVRCSCGDSFWARRNSLPSGNTTSCNKCGLRSTALVQTFSIDSGNRFGKFTVLRPWGSAASGENKSLVKCGCGRQEIVREANLKSGNTSQCQVCRLRSRAKSDKDADEQWPTGYRAGKLVVLRHWGRSQRGMQRVLCQCDCGNQHVADVIHIFYSGSNQYQYCPNCNPLGFESTQQFLDDPYLADQPCHLYLARVNNEYLKPGISSDPERRMRESDGHYKSYAFRSPAMTRAEAWAIEQCLLKESIDAKPESLSAIYDNWGGHSELRLKDVFPESWYVNRFWELLEHLNEIGWEGLAPN